MCFAGLYAGHPYIHLISFENFLLACCVHTCIRKDNIKKMFNNIIIAITCNLIVTLFQLVSDHLFVVTDVQSTCLVGYDVLRVLEARAIAVTDIS